MAAVERAVREDSALALVVQRAGVSAAEIEATRGVLRKLAQVDLDDLLVPPGFNVSSDGEVGGANCDTPAWQSYMDAAAFVAAAGRLEAAVQRGHNRALDALSDFVNGRRQQGSDVSLASLDRMMMRRLLSSDVDTSTADAVQGGGETGELKATATAAECTCVYSCADNPETRCSLSGSWHVHPVDPLWPGCLGPCPQHPGVPGDK